jgi:ABC-type sugar transport system ATPase subunit
MMGAALRGGSHPTIQFRNVTVQFGTMKALDSVGFSVAAGEIISVIGENGAGKSTLMKVAAGLLRPNGGELFIDGEQQHFSGAADARAAGIRLVPQELTLADDLSIAENISLGRMARTRGGWTDVRTMRSIAVDGLARLGVLDIDVDTPVGDLPVVLKSFVQIARALGEGARVLVLDEPTAPMSDAEVNRFLAVVDQIARSGIAVIYVSHRLDEVFRISTRVVVLRDGKLILDHQLSEVARSEVIAAMVGGRDLAIGGHTVNAGAPVVLDVNDLTTSQVHGVSFAVHAGEIVAIYGIAGSGREAIGAAIVGATRGVHGRVSVDGVALPRLSIRASAAAGIGYLAPERRTMGLLFESSIRDNLTLSTLHRFSRAGVLALRRERQAVLGWIQKLHIAAPSPEVIVGSLSGGSQQKVLIARALESTRRVLVLEEPTRGVDIATKAEIYRLLAELAATGLAILVISSDLEEVALVASRVLVVRRGEIVADNVPPIQSTIAEIANTHAREASNV